MDQHWCQWCRDHPPGYPRDFCAFTHNRMLGVTLGPVAFMNKDGSLMHVHGAIFVDPGELTLRGYFHRKLGRLRRVLKGSH